MYPFMLFALASCAIAIVGMFLFANGIRAKNAEKTAKAAYWFLGAVVTLIAGLGFFLAS